MLRKIRISLAAVIFTLITLLFLDFTGTLHAWFGWLAKIQFLPALLALNIGVIILLVALTLLFGRVYCSVICPMGVFQDVVAWISKKVCKKKKYTYSKALTWLRYTVLAVIIIAFIAGIGSMVALLDPYGAYGRIASNLFGPIYKWVNNFFAYLAERANSYAFYSVDVWIKNGITFFIALATFVLIAILAFKNGRTYCNTVCPVGTVLGLLSKYSLYKPVINADKCINCKKCVNGCKASCIDLENKKIDYSRCVSCFNCIDKCNVGAMKYVMASKGSKSVSEKEPSNASDGDNSRRKFVSIATMAAVGTALKAQTAIVNPDGGLADIEEKKASIRATRIVPPGAKSLKNLAKHCTGCQLCVSVCPNNVLRPSKDPKKWMQPEMSYERGYCRPECTKCSEVCPTGAIEKITAADKSAIKIGSAVWIRENCIVVNDEKPCTECQRHCPTGAITMVALNPEDEKQQDTPRPQNSWQQPMRNSKPILRTPVIDFEKCIGCGECEHLCPGRPYSAIYVEGIEVHHMV